MTVLANPITFNSGAGSDTAASGSGSGAVRSGTGASTNNTTTVDLSADTPDLSVVAAGDLLWVGSSSGRQFSVIASVDDGADTVTVDDVYTQTEGSRNWGIGGERATLDNADSRALSVDHKDGWIIELADDQTLTTTGILWDPDANGDVLTIRSNSTTIRTITQTADTYVFQLNNGSGIPIFVLENIKTANSAGAKTAADGLVLQSAIVRVNTCIFGDTTNTLRFGIGAGSGLQSFRLVDTEIVNTTSHGIATVSGSNNQQIQIIGSWIHGCGGDGVNLNNSRRVDILDSLITGNTGDGIKARAADIGTIRGNTIHGNTLDGIDITVTTGSLEIAIYNNNITANGNWGIRGTGNTQDGSYIDWNNYGTGATANTSGAATGIAIGPNALAIDPQYTAAGSDDYSVGTNLKAAGFPDSARTIGANQSGTTSFVDVGGAQREEAGGGGGGGSPLHGPL